MLKKFKDLICPNCGANEPVFSINFKLRAWANDDWKNSYDLEFDDDYAYMEGTILDEINDGTAKCECASCGAEIKYYIEDDKDEVDNL